MIDLPPPRLRVGVSACLVGSEVRFDGGHKRNRFLTDALAPHVELVSVCPELELGLGVPRPAMRLERHGESTRLVVPSTGADHTEAMEKFARQRVRRLARENLSGFVFKKGSPSCGLERVRVHSSRDGAPAKNGRGLFAQRFLAEEPNLPVEEEGRLEDPHIRENWIERIFAYRRLQDLWSTRWTLGNLVAFHTRHKLTLLAHSPKAARDLGRLVAGAKGVPRTELREAYGRDFMATLACMATPRRHVNVLQHVLGHFRGRIDDGSRHELAGVIDDYRQGLVPLVVPITLVRHTVRLLEIDWIAEQTYLNPHPKELALRNRV